MESIKVTFLEAAIKWLTGGALLELAKKLVTNINDADMTNEQKHASVITDLKKFGTEFGTTVLDIVVKVAVLWLQVKMGVPNGEPANITN